MQQRTPATNSKSRRPDEGQKGPDGSVFRKGLWHYPDTSGFGNYSRDKDYSPADLDVTALISSIEAAHQPKTYPDRRTWHVDSEAGTNEASGESADTAVKSIQAALDRASTCSLTIWTAMKSTMAPGWSWVMKN